MRWQRIFDTVIRKYIEVKMTHGTHKALNYAHTSSGGGNPYIVRPSLSDFICDVEIKARKALSASEWAMFSALYVEQTSDPLLCSNELPLGIKTKLGRAFDACHIYPINLYMRGKDLRRAGRQ